MQGTRSLDDRTLADWLKRNRVETIQGTLRFDGPNNYGPDLVRIKQIQAGKWVQPALGKTRGFLPLFQGPPYGVGMLAAGIILAIMVVPYITAVSREVLLAVPTSQREAALALGATRWETTRIAVLRYGRSGLVGAILLGLGRALGETMAVTMVIGNRPEVAVSLFAPGYTMASVVANEFAEATSDLYLAALIEIGLLLFVVTVIVNALARLLVWSVGGPVKAVRE